MHTRSILEMNNLAVSFENPGGPRIRAVEDCSFTLRAGECVALVGESGSGKSVSALSILRLLRMPPARIDRGRIDFSWTHDRSIDLASSSEKTLRSIRGSHIAMIFQEPMTSLNPVFTIGEQIMEAIVLHQFVSRKKAGTIACEALRDVGIPEGERRMKQYPHEFSGGMRQRVMIAMALACRPSVLIADEPTTALDVTVQAQILELIRQRRRERGLGVLLVTHDLGIVAQQADHVCVMYAGRVVESAPAGVLFERPLHPYTRGLLRCVPRLGEVVPRLVTVQDVIDAPGEFDRPLAEGLNARPWWPHHPTPERVERGEFPADDSRMIQIGSDHRVRVWNEPIVFRART